MNLPSNDVADELAIRALTAAYTDAINRADVDDIAGVYDDDAVLTLLDRPSVIGRPAILETLRATLGRYQLVVQLLHSGVVQLDGDRARARWQVTELQLPVDATARFIVGRYEDELVRRPHGWRFARRTFTARYLGDTAMSSGVLPDGPALFPLWPGDASGAP